MVDSKTVTYLGLVDADGIRQGYFLSRNLEALKEVWDRIISATEIIESGRKFKFYDLEDVLKDAASEGDPAVIASQFLKGDEVIYVPVNMVCLGMLDRLLSGLDERTTTHKYMQMFYPKLIMNPLLESAIICDLCLQHPEPVVLESRKKK